jgi:gentisate 1,2-dioxygenase
MLAHFNSTFREDAEARRPAEAPFTGLIHFPYARARAALDRLARSGAPDAHIGHLMRYTDPVDGSWAMATMAPTIRRLPAGFATRPYRSSDSAIFAAVEGRGEIRVGDTRLDLEPHDVAVVPGWMAFTLHAAEDWTLFAFSDRVAQEKLGFFREQRL